MSTVHHCFFLLSGATVATGRTLIRGISNESGCFVRRYTVLIGLLLL
jgi:hypothetical protein